MYGSKILFPVYDKFARIAEVGSCAAVDNVENNDINYIIEVGTSANVIHLSVVKMRSRMQGI